MEQTKDIHIEIVRIQKEIQNYLGLSSSSVVFNYSEIDGKVEEVLFREGSLVEKGSVLVRLDTSTLEAERDRALYRYELAQRQEERQRRLLDDGLLSQEEYDFSLGELNVLRAE